MEGFTGWVRRGSLSMLCGSLVALSWPGIASAVREPSHSGHPPSHAALAWVPSGGSLQTLPVGERALISRTLGGAVSSQPARPTRPGVPLHVTPSFKTALMASNRAADDELGVTVAVSGGTVVASAEAPTISAVYIFQEPRGGWADEGQVAELSPPTGSGEFGSAVAISGQTVVVGAPSTGFGRGAAYVYQQQGGTWKNTTTPAAVLTGSDSGSADAFGAAVAISGDTIVVGAPEHKGGSSPFAGAAYVFQEPAGGWSSGTQTAELSSTDGSLWPELGYSVALSGSTVVASDDACGADPAAFVFSEPKGGWIDGTQTAVLTSSDKAECFGASLSISGATIAVGAPEDPVAALQTGDGAVYVFQQPKKGWANATQSAKLTASDLTYKPGEYAGDVLGGSVAIFGQTILAGAWVDAGADSTQRVYVFQRQANGWVNGTRTIEINGIANGDGYSPGPLAPVALSDEALMAGDAAGGSAGQGAVEVYPFTSPFVVNSTEIGPGLPNKLLNGCDAVEGYPAAIGVLVNDAPGNTIGPAVDVSDVGGCDLDVTGTKATGNTIGGIALGVDDKQGADKAFPTGWMVDQDAGSNVLTGALGPSGLGPPDFPLKEPNLIGYLVLGSSGNEVLGTQATDTLVTGDDNMLGGAVSGGSSPRDVFGNVLGATGGTCSDASTNNSAIALQGSGNQLENDQILDGCGAGVFVADTGAGTQILHNAISGNGSSGHPATGGIVIDGSSHDIVDSNSIDNNASSGIVVLDTGEDQAVDDTIHDNSIYKNGGLGIDLGGDGVSPVEGSPFLPNPGPNRMLNYPQFVHITWSAGTVQLIGQLLNVGGQKYQIEVFANSQCNGSGYGEGEKSLGSFTVNTLGLGRLTGEADFDVTLPASGEPGKLITASATDPQGDTSEFSACSATGKLGTAAVGMATGASHAAQGAGIAGVLSDGGASATGAAGGTGTYSITATARVSSTEPSAVKAGANTVTVLSGTIDVHRVGTFKLNLKLTAAGRRLLLHAELITLTFTASYKLSHHHGSVSTKVTIGRKGRRPSMIDHVGVAVEDIDAARVASLLGESGDSPAEPPDSPMFTTSPALRWRSRSFYNASEPT
jgi:hypothetical protein